MEHRRLASYLGWNHYPLATDGNVWNKGPQSSHIQRHDANLLGFHHVDQDILLPEDIQWAITHCHHDETSLLWFKNFHAVLLHTCPQVFNDFGYPTCRQLRTFIWSRNTKPQDKKCISNSRVQALAILPIAHIHSDQNVTRRLRFHRCHPPGSVLQHHILDYVDLHCLYDLCHLLELYYRWG